MAPAAQSRFVFVDALRGLAALAVVAFHAYSGGHLDAIATELPGWLRATLAHGDAGVSVFFVLSGFVIAHAMRDDRVDGRYLARFVARRAVRLDPAYWASIVLALGVGLASAQFVAGKTYVLPTAFELFAQLTYTSVIFDLSMVNDVYWTLYLEVQFYLTYALTLFVVTRYGREDARERMLDAALFAATLVADALPLGLVPEVGPAWLVQFWHLFLMGVWVQRATRSEGGRRPLILAMAALQIVTLLGVALASANVALGVAAVTGAALLVGGLRERLGQWLSWRPLQGLGAISYSLYLTHNCLTGGLFRAAHGLLGQSGPAIAASFVLVMLGSVGFAWVFYLAIERPSLALSRRIVLRGDSRVPAPPEVQSEPTSALPA